MHNKLAENSFGPYEEKSVKRLAAIALVLAILMFAAALWIIKSSRSDGLVSLGWTLAVLVFGITWALVLYFLEERLDFIISRQHPGVFRALLMGGGAMSCVAMVLAYKVPGDSGWWGMPIFGLFGVVGVAYFLEWPSSSSPLYPLW